MTLNEVRSKYLEFFKKQGHQVIPSASLIPEGDGTTLFTGSGMQPLLPYLLGETHPGGKRLTDSQKSFRAEDIEEIGDNRHTTFFEMLGNWSLGDYFKEEQIPWMFEFLTKEIGLDPNKLYVTCFIGAPEYSIPKDTEAASLWKKAFSSVGIDALEAEIGSEANGYVRGMKPGERIFFYDGSKNWWNRGKTGPATTPVGDPCGPDSEMFFDFGTPHDPKFGEHCHPNCDCGRFMEIGNNVFMAYRKEAEGKFIPLQSKNIDHGSGLERITAASNNDPDVFRLDVFQKIIGEIEKISHASYRDENAQRYMRVIADHARAATMLISDGVTPSNKGQGYVLRRLIRRALRYSHLLGVNQPFVHDLARIVVNQYVGVYSIDSDVVSNVISEEENRFEQTLSNGLMHLNKFMQEVGQQFSEALDTGSVVGGKEYKLEDLGRLIFDLYQNFGFPIDITIEELIKHGFISGQDKKSTLGISPQELIRAFNEEKEKHQEISRAGQEKKFGGHGLLLDTGEIKARDEKELVVVTRLHTATHMLQQALRDVLGPEVKQAGSDITVERTRFDFTFSRKLTPEEIKKVEDRVNEKIEEDLKVQKVVMPKAEAEKTGALFFFKQKYPDPVNVYYMGDTLETAWSKEFCGGPHVNHTAEVLKFKIAKEEAVAAGVRRIRGVVE